jgi:hypothetical protein
MALKVTESIPRRVCRDEFLKKLRASGVDTDGYEYSLEPFVLNAGYKLPTPCDKKQEYESFVFCVGKYTQVWINYSDALANQVLLLSKLGFLK